MDAKGGSSAPSFVDRAQLKRKQALISFINARKRSSLPPAKRVKTPSGSFSRCPGGEVVVKDFINFKKSRSPVRIMYFCQGEWVDFPSKTTPFLKQAFDAGRSEVQVIMAGVLYLVDFAHMLKIDLKSGSQTSIAWIDVAGKCFFPRVVCEGEGNLSSSSFDVRMGPKNNGFKGSGVKNCNAIADRVLKPVDVGDSSEQGSNNSCDNSDVSDSECPTCSVRDHATNEAFVGLGDNLIKLEDGGQEYMAIRNKFFAGLGTLVTFTSVVGIYRHSHTSVSGQSRSQAFKGHADIIMRKNEGNVNIRYAWHGTSRNGVCGIIKHGFGQPKSPIHGAALGNGVYLAPANCAYVSAVYCDVDENGDQHMVLCRVILGNVEQVRPGSQQFHPSSEEFDTGVDDLRNPRRYIVWSTHMNTNILPEYVVSFKVSPDLPGYWSKMKARQQMRSVLDTDGGQQPCPALIEKLGQPCPDLVKESQHKMQGHVLMPTSAWMSFPKLFGVIEKFLSSSSVSLMKKHYADYKESKISREDLIRRLRMIAGDRLLISAIKMFRGQVHPPMKNKMSYVPEK